MDWASIGNSLGQGVLSSVVNTGLDYLLPFSKSTERAYREQREAQQRDQDFQREMWNKTSWWNSPVNQGRLMSQGGFSPAALFGQNGSSIAQMSQPSGGSHGITPHMTMAENNPFGSFSSVAQAMQSVSQASKNVAEIPKVQAEIDKLFADAHLADAKKTYQDLYNTFYRAYGKRLMENEVNEGVSRYLLNLANARLAIEQGNIQDSQRLLNLAKRDEANALSGLYGAQRSQVEAETKFVTSSLELRLDNLRADTRQKNAESENYEIFNKLHNDRRYRHAYLGQALDAARAIAKQNKITDKQLNLIEEQIESAVYANSNKEFTYWSDRLNKTIETVGSAASQFYGAGALRELIHLRKGMQVPPTQVKGFGQ